ncbi:MAG: acireductone synthase [Gammaproteobacteria bacterium]|nr:acireductone synthase [Gammaproteobacteria bacterium]
MIKAIVTDIEGTTSSLSFVKDVLFPYARQHLAEYVKAEHKNSKVLKILEEVRELVGDASWTQAQLIEQLIRWIDEDKKITPLKSLQGMIWKAGFEGGAFKGHVYPDAVEYLKQWHANGLQLFVFSSGSVDAQKLLFGYSEFGDLRPLFSGYFDTNIGSKREESAYRHIMEDIGCSANEILFLSDIKEELDAAAATGMRTIQLVREPVALVSSHRQVASFDQIDLVAVGN